MGAFSAAQDGATMTVFPDDQWQEAAPAAVGLDGKRLAAAVRALVRITGPQGSSQCAIVRDGRLVWHGPDVDCMHGVWSCTKSILSLTVGLLVEDGRCTVQTRAADIHPPLERHYPTMTLRHLLTFTSGYRPRAASRDAPALEPAEPLFAPGTRFHYSWDPYLLALLATKLAGEPLDELFRRRIADPIGLDGASWQWGRLGSFDALTGLRGVPVCGGSGLWDCGLAITARAMARLGWLVACDGLWNGRRVIDSHWLREATSPQTSPALPPHDAAAWYRPLPGRYGYYWWTNGPDTAGRRLWPSATERTCAIQGNQDNYCFVIPEWRMVVVRLGTDGGISNTRYDEFFAALREAVAL